LIYKFIIIDEKPVNVRQPSSEHFGVEANAQLREVQTIQTAAVVQSMQFRMNDVIYKLPPTNMYRSCSFGYGNKISFIEKEKSPPPGTYECKSEFPKLSRYNTISMHIGRNMVKFGSLYQSECGPSPNAYRIRTEYFNERKTITIAPKLPTEFDLISQNKTPGPGNYELDATEMKGSGSYILSNYQNHISPTYLNPVKKGRSRSPDSHSLTIGPGQCKAYPTQMPPTMKGSDNRCCLSLRTP
jgi:hypothetical protein